MSRTSANLHARLRAVGVQGDVISAMESVDRALFVPSAARGVAYDDIPIDVTDLSGRLVTVASQPSAIALTVAAAGLRPGQRVLDVGSGTGYQSAILGALVGAEGEVVGVDLLDELVDLASRAIALTEVRNVRLTRGDASLPIELGGPFDAIVAGAALPSIPSHWLQLLTSSGRIVAPVCFGHPGVQTLYLFHRLGDVLHGRPLAHANYFPFLGPAPRFPQVAVMPGWRIFSASAGVWDELVSRSPETRPFDRFTFVDLMRFVHWLAARNPGFIEARMDDTVRNDGGYLPGPPNVRAWPGLRLDGSIALLHRMSEEVLVADPSSTATLPFYLSIYGGESAAARLASELSIFRAHGSPGPERLEFDVYPKRVEPGPVVRGDALVELDWGRLLVRAAPRPWFGEEPPASAK
jgi:protein-L-isoaspartate(D-aspartate) O-methyltransferase